MRDAERKGEWLVLQERQEEAHRAPEESAVKILALPEHFARKLSQAEGIARKGNRLQIHLFPDETDRYAEEWALGWSEVEMLYEDDWCLVANKPAGMAVHPSAPGQIGTLAHAVAAHYAFSGQQCKVRHIHRLDEHTSGPVLYAKNELAQLRLDAAMREKAIGRTYVAFVGGIIQSREGIVDAPIGSDRHHGARRRVSRNGEPAVTRYERLETYGSASLVKLTLETGRTHQIRVHMSHLGHPLLGDALYGGSERLIRRQALHGEALEFAHPLSRELVRVEADWPADLAELQRRLRADKKKI